MWASRSHSLYIRRLLLRELHLDTSASHCRFPPSHRRTYLSLRATTPSSVANSELWQDVRCTRPKRSGFISCRDARMSKHCLLVQVSPEGSVTSSFFACMSCLCQKTVSTALCSVRSVSIFPQMMLKRNK